MASPENTDSPGTSGNRKVATVGIRTKRLLERSSVGILLDHYDDIFSDFDPRPFGERSISDDFLNQTRKEALEKKGGEIQLSLLIPAGLRDAKVEEQVILRLRSHYEDQALASRKAVAALKRRGALFIAAGVGVNLVSGLLAYYLPEKNFLLTLLTVVLEPAGWFTIWNGGDLLFFSPAAKIQDRNHYLRMARAEILFTPY